MKPAAVLAFCVLLAASAGCASADTSDTASASAQDLTQESALGVVHEYYGAFRGADVEGTLDAIMGDAVVLEAPSVAILNPLGGTDEVRGKAAVVKALVGAAFLLKNASIADASRANDPTAPVAMSVMTPAGASKALVVSRIRLPLPDGDVITQVEFFEVENGKINHIQSYYDATRFIAALPAIAVAKLKDAFSK